MIWVCQSVLGCHILARTCCWSNVMISLCIWFDDNQPWGACVTTLIGKCVWLAPQASMSDQLQSFLLAYTIYNKTQITFHLFAHNCPLLDVVHIDSSWHPYHFSSCLTSEQVQAYIYKPHYIKHDDVIYVPLQGFYCIIHHRLIHPRPLFYIWGCQDPNCVPWDHPNVSCHSVDCFLSSVWGETWMHKQTMNVY